MSNDERHVNDEERAHARTSRKLNAQPSKEGAERRAQPDRPSTTFGTGSVLSYSNGKCDS